MRNYRFAAVDRAETPAGGARHALVPLRACGEKSLVADGRRTKPDGGATTVWAGKRCGRLKRVRGRRTMVGAARCMSHRRETSRTVVTAPRGPMLGRAAMTPQKT